MAHSPVIDAADFLARLKGVGDKLPTEAILVSLMDQPVVVTTIDVVTVVVNLVPGSIKTKSA